MDFKIQILIFLISTIISSPPPTPVPPYKVSIEEPKLKEAKQSISNLRKLGNDGTEPKQFVESTKVIVNILEKGVLEEHDVNLTTKNLNESNCYTHYGFSISLSQGESLEVKSNSCYKLKLSGTANLEEEDKCIASETKDANTYRFSYNYTLFSGEYIIIKYSYLITKETPEILFRQESISVPGIYKGGICDYKFVLPDSYSNLGLKSYNFTKESDKIYTYKGNCPSEQIADEVRLSPKESFWIADLGINFESQEQIRNNVTVVFPRMYRGGKNRNENYTITTYEGEVLNESNIIKDEIFLEASIPGKNNKKIGVNLTTAFSNKLDDEFIVYTSENFYDIKKDNINDTIKTKAEEILNNRSSEYKDKPNYYKIGKFVNSYMTYDLSFHGKNLTVNEIYEKKRGVCEHYTILYNAMLNAIGIKTIKTFGWAFDKDQTYANESTVGHAWTVALINDSFIELDSTWGLFEGIPAGHILKGFNQEEYSYYSSTKQNISKRHNLQLVNCSGANYSSSEQNPSTSSQNTSSSSGTNPSSSSGANSSSSSGTNPSSSPGINPSSSPGINPSSSPGTNPSSSPGTNPSSSSGTNPSSSSGTNPSSSPGTNPSSSSEANPSSSSKANPSSSSKANPSSSSVTNSSSSSETNPSSSSGTNPSSSSETNPSSSSAKNSSSSSGINPSSSSAKNSSSSSETNPSSSSSSESKNDSTEKINSTLLLPKKLLVGYDGYTLSSDEINFFAYARYFSVEPDQIIPFIIRITKNLRTLEEQIINATCSLKSFKDSMAKYECKTDKVSGRISNVEIVGNLADKIVETDLCKAMGNNLQNQKGEKISEEGIIVLDECKITNNTYYQYIIICSVDSSTNSSLNGKNANLYIVQKDDKIKEVPAKLKGSEELNIQIDPKYFIKANLNNTIGKIDKGKNLYLVFKKGENSDLIQPGFDIYMPKKSSGLQTGGIIAIVIVCILLLIGAISFIFFMRKRAPVVENNNIINKTTSSSIIINDK